MDIYDSLQYLRNYSVKLEHLSVDGGTTHGVARIATPSAVYRIPVHFEGSADDYQRKCEDGLEHLVRQPLLFPVPAPKQATLFRVYTSEQPHTIPQDRPVHYEQLKLFEPNPYQLKLDF